jgi:hypothetical protein
MGFGIADILHRVCCRVTPNSLSGGGSSLFGSAVWITKLKSATAEDIYHARRMRMPWLFFARLEAVLEDAHLIVFQQHFVILGRCFHGVLCVGRWA